MKTYEFHVTGFPAFLLLATGVFLFGAGILHIVEAGLKLATRFMT